MEVLRHLLPLAFKKELRRIPFPPNPNEASIAS
jgi:hypothetical protein